MENMVTIPEAAKRLGCTRQNVYQTIKRHKIPTPEKRTKRQEIITRHLKVRYVDLTVLEGIIGADDEATN